MKKREFFGSMLLLGAAFGMPWPVVSGTTAPSGRVVLEELMEPAETYVDYGCRIGCARWPSEASNEIMCGVKRT